VTLGLDTSVVVRLLMGVPEAPARAARRRLEHAAEAGETVLVSDLVISEAYHALQYHYGVPKAEARSLLR
jgi:predicted nucleic acid-binding protein